MKTKRLRKLIRKVLDATPEPMVTVKTVTICFKDKTVEIDGSKYSVESECFAFPILSNTVIFAPHSGLARIA